MQLISFIFLVLCTFVKIEKRYLILTVEFKIRTTKSTEIATNSLIYDLIIFFEYNSTLINFLFNFVPTFLTLKKYLYVVQ